MEVYLSDKSKSNTSNDYGLYINNATELLYLSSNVDLFQLARVRHIEPILVIFVDYVINM